MANINKILDQNGTEQSRMATIGRYFRLPNEGTMDFMKGCTALTDEDKEELALGAAKEMGWTVVAVG